MSEKERRYWCFFCGNNQFNKIRVKNEMYYECLSCKKVFRVDEVIRVFLP